MTKNYKQIITHTGSEIVTYEENGYLISFPKDESNADYQRYLRWLENPDAEEGGTL